MRVDTWPAVAVCFAVAVGVFLIGKLLDRPYRIRPTTSADPYELAYLAEDTDRVIYAALARLRHAKLIEATDDGLIRTVAPPPASLVAAERAVLAAIGHQATRRQIFYAARLTAPAYHRPAPTRRAVLPGVILLCLAAIYFVVAAMRLNRAGSQDSIGSVMVLLAFVSLLSGPQFFARPKQTGDLLALARSGHTGPFIPDRPALSVALFGTAAIWAMDRDFAWRADIPADRRPGGRDDRDGPDYEWDHDGAGGSGGSGGDD